MADPNNWDNRVMFERYLYDYLRKHNMHHTAETFKQEANPKIDPTNPPAIDVPDGFLYEWWLVFYDIFSAGLPMMMKTRPQSNASLSREYDMNEQTFGRLAVSADHGLTTWDNLLPSMGWPLTGTEQIPQGLSSSQHQQDLLAPQKSSRRILYPPGILADLIGQEVGSTVHAASRMANIAPNERSRKRKNQSDSEDGCSNMPGLANFPSETLSEIQKSSDDHIKPSSSHANENKDGGGISFSDLLACCISPEAEFYKVREVEGILKEWCDNFSSSP